METGIAGCMLLILFSEGSLCVNKMNVVGQTRLSRFSRLQANNFNTLQAFDTKCPEPQYQW